MKNLSKPELAANGSTAEQIADVVYEVVTDEKHKLHYTAGADSKAMYERRLAVGAEVWCQEMTEMFLA